MKCVFVGEAWGEAETNYEAPFLGSAGQELYRMIGQAGFPVEGLPYQYTSPMTMLTRWSTFPYPLLNVFNEQPRAQDNSVQAFYAHLRDKIKIDQSYGSRRFGTSNYYVRADKVKHIQRLHDTLQKLQPNLIVALGATACWALELGAGIGKLRGFVHKTPFGKVLPVYHPAAILRNWSLRAVTLLDLAKARRELQFPGFRLINREIWTEPTIQDLWAWWEQYGKASPLLAIDIETLKRKLISEVGFASDKHHALHIPFCWEETEGSKKTCKTWFSPADETKAWQFVKHVCESDRPKILQNGKYDTYWLAKELNITVRNWTEDTMVAAHAWQPELGKSLYDLGAIFLQEKDWKSIRKETIKDKAND